MSSEARASSGVRNLRSLFENKGTLDADTSSSRGRSPGGVGGDKENGSRPTSKVRASFVPVEPVASMATNGDAGQHDTPPVSRGRSEQTLAHVFPASISKDGRADHSEDAVPNTATTPMKKQDDAPVIDQDDSPLGQKRDKPPANPDKPTMATEEDPVEMKPADPTDASAVSGGQALPPVAEDLRASSTHAAVTGKEDSGSKKANGPVKTNGGDKPAPITTKAAAKSTLNTVKSPSQHPRTPRAPEGPAPTKSLATKASRSSLTAPTAASLARSGVPEKPGHSKTSPISTTKKRETTKPVSLPSHLTAPTAASRAKHDAASAPSASSSNLRASTTSRPKASLPTKSSTRKSLPYHHRPASQTSQNAAPRRTYAPADGSFLERMMKPTAASAGKAHEKVEAKTSPKSKAPAPKPKANGTASKTAHKSSAAAKSHDRPQDVHAESHIESQQAAETTEAAPNMDGRSSGLGSKSDPAAAEVPGDATPVHSTDDSTTNAALEATPAGITGDETIR